MSSTSFTDRSGRKWELRCTLDTIRSVSVAQGIALNRIASDPAVMTALEDPVTVADVLATMLEPELQARSVSRSDFESALDGNTLETATESLLEAVAGFLPSTQSKLLRGALATMRSAKERANAAAERALASGAIDRAVAKQLANVEAEIAKMDPDNATT